MSQSPKLAEAFRQASEQSRKLGVNEQGLPAELLGQWETRVGNPLASSINDRAEELQVYVPEAVFDLWFHIISEATLPLLRGGNEAFILLEQDPHRELIELRRILDEDGFGHNITGHLATVDGQTGFGATIRW
jgi:hypothetical protein